MLTTEEKELNPRRIGMAFLRASPWFSVSSVVRAFRGTFRRFQGCAVPP